MAKTLEDFRKSIEASLEDIGKINFQCELLGAQEANVQLQLRTFATGGSGVKDIGGKKLSKYSPAYAKKREKAGLQVANKDLIFSSNTSVIKDNIAVGLSGGKSAMGFVNQEGAKIAGYQEEREKTVIFKLNDSEVANVSAAVKKFGMDSIKKISEGWNK